MLHTGFLRTAFHLMVQIALDDRKKRSFFAVQRPNIVLHFLAKKLRHLDRPNVLFRLGTGDHIFTVKAVIRFIDRDEVLVIKNGLAT